MGEKRYKFMSTKFGHRIHIYGDEYTVTTDGVKRFTAWRYDDNDELTDEAPERKCPKCGEFPTKDGHDPCIANLPGVRAACCGHGIPGEAYVFFESGQVIRGKFDK